MKTEDRFPIWIWVVAPVVVVVAAVALLALLRQGEPDDSEAATTLEAIADRPSQFFGESVTVSGEVTATLGRRSFLISERFIAGDLLVVSPVPLSEMGGQSRDASLTEVGSVRVTGEVVKFDIAGAEQEIGADLSEGRLDAYVGTPAIIADSVSLNPPDIFEEGAREAPGRG